MEDFEEAKPQSRRWLYILSPCVIATIFSLFFILYGYLSQTSTGGYSFIVVLIYAPTLLVTVLSDLVLKLIFKRKIKQIWILEILIILIAFHFMVSPYF